MQTCFSSRLKIYYSGFCPVFLKNQLQKSCSWNSTEKSNWSFTTPRRFDLSQTM